MSSKNAAIKMYSDILKNTGISCDSLSRENSVPSKNSKGEKTPRQLERHLKGVANHRRIEILMLVAKNKGISLEGIATALDCNIKTVSDHSRRLVQAGLLNKKYRGTIVEHSLSPYGKHIHRFLKLF